MAGAPGGGSKEVDAMTAIRRNGWTMTAALFALAAAMPLAAQETPPPADSGNSVGPPQLEDFTLNGTTTTPAADPPAEAAPPPARSTTPTPPRSEPRAPVADRLAPSAAPASSSTGPAAQPATAAPAPATDVGSSVTVALPPPRPATGNGVVSSGLASSDAPVEGGFGWLPWLAALIAAAAAAGLIVWQRKQRALSYAAAPVLSRDLLRGDATAPPRPIPAARTPTTPAPKPAEPKTAVTPKRTPAAAPQPAPKPAPTSTPPATAAPAAGIVSTGLKPDLHFEFQPKQAQIGPDGSAAIQFEMVVTNRGGAPARDLLIEACMVNAGPAQDAEIGQFFQKPAGSGDRMPLIPPMGRIALKSRVALPADQVRSFEVEGRRLFVPLVAFNALYRFNGQEEQKSASFLVGRGGADGGKMGPIRLDQGARAFAGLGARQHSTGLQR